LAGLLHRHRDAGKALHGATVVDSYCRLLRRGGLLLLDHCLLDGLLGGLLDGLLDGGLRRYRRQHAWLLNQGLLNQGLWNRWLLNRWLWHRRLQDLL
jgi:hypothetical protein